MSLSPFIMLQMCPYLELAILWSVPYRRLIELEPNFLVCVWLTRRTHYLCRPKVIVWRKQLQLPLDKHCQINSYKNCMVKKSYMKLPPPVPWFHITDITKSCVKEYILMFWGSPNQSSTLAWVSGPSVDNSHFWPMILGQNLAQSARPADLYFQAESLYCPGYFMPGQVGRTSLFMAGVIT